MQYLRWQQKNIISSLKTRRVIFLSGARQCGKTTLVRDLESPEMEYRTLDNLTMLQSAKSDPENFIKHYNNKSMIIDEVQRVPELLLSIKKAVDENARNGQYLLTGSANIQASPLVQESLAGRIRKIRLRPLSQGEIEGGSFPNFIQKAFSKNFKSFYDTYDKDAILELAFRGGFPEPLKLKDKERKLWHRDYIEALLERDLKDIARIQHKDAMKNLLVITAAWSSKFMDVSRIGSGLSIKRPTTESYLNALEAMYIIEHVKPWIKTDYDRVGKQDKLFMTDCGLMGSILNWHMDQVRLDSDKIGKLIETFVFSELSAQIDASEEQILLYHYRDREKREIDFVIENENGDLLGIEVKAGSYIDNADFKHLNWFAENLAGKRRFKGIILYTGNSVMPFGNSMMAVPINCLWS